MTSSNMFVLLAPSRFVIGVSIFATDLYSAVSYSFASAASLSRTVIERPWVALHSCSHFVKNIVASFARFIAHPPRPEASRQIHCRRHSCRLSRRGRSYRKNVPRQCRPLVHRAPRASRARIPDAASYLPGVQDSYGLGHRASRRLERETQ